jgi:hypothetical protein
MIPDGILNRPSIILALPPIVLPTPPTMASSSSSRKIAISSIAVRFVEMLLLLLLCSFQFNIAHFEVAGGFRRLWYCEAI